MKADHIHQVLEDFISSKYQKILIDGTWGIGKTKYISDFLENHTYSCYVSLFGKRDTDSIIHEIYFSIIEQAPRGSITKHFRTIRETMKNLDVSFKGLSLSVPLIGSLYKTLEKQLLRNEGNSLLIIFDDLERKHDNLDIKEVFGILDSLSKFKGIKVVLVAATDQLNEKNKTTFNEYKEKAIDRHYEVSEYASEAPAQILKNDVWQVVKILVQEFNFNNLRTFEKINMFINEVVNKLGEDIFKEKFTKADLYKMCFASVFFNVEHKAKMILLEEDNSTSKIRNGVYKESESGEIEYLYRYILKCSLDNQMSKNVFRYINDWFKTGTYSKEEILTIVDAINSYEETPHNFFSSDQEILSVIENCKRYLCSLKGTENINDVLSRISTAFLWAEVMSVDIGITEDEIVKKLSKHVVNMIDLTKGSYQNQVSTWNIESERAIRIANRVNDDIILEYFRQLLGNIELHYLRGKYDENHYLKQLYDSIISVKEGDLREAILKCLKEHQYFFPMPSGKITESQWYWCRMINKLIKEIEVHWDMENYHCKFEEYIMGKAVSNDKMLKNRLSYLFEKK
ncbi:hypothetical protein JSY36_11830 [Bacillus sp. H-16]|uniref:gas vesicle protein GvpD n=1 Tax=Alteribacter salitolerans TaxID=2912333 RepID=UPI00196390A0|nr:gas vesicle protein GvpD [Alteribacter salitolerans]MBM7096435.1 hypothetical protein [Alteribacter salitolerans]